MASERVVDVQGDDDDFEEVPPPTHEAPNSQPITPEPPTARSSAAGAAEFESQTT
jgi:hypothetical protein